MEEALIIGQRILKDEPKDQNKEKNVNPNPRVNVKGN